jgi:cytochrome P450
MVTMTRPAVARLIPEARGRSSVATTLAFHHDQIGFLAAALRANPDIVRIRLLGTPLIMVNHPDYVQHVLVDNHENYNKDTALFRAVRPVLRNGLIGAVGGELWHRQRRLMQPSFHRPKTAAFVGNMTAETADMLERWRQRHPGGGVVDVSSETGQLALRIVGRNLFGTDVGQSSEALEQAFTRANTIMTDFFRFPFPPLSVPTPAHLKLRRLIAWFDRYVDELIERRRAPGYQGDDLLAVLAEAIDEETGEPMPAQQLHEEVVNIMIGGYETATLAVSWLLHHVARDQEIQRRLHAEVDAELGGRTPGFGDLGRLTYLRMVADETLRMNTPAWQTMRGVVHDDEIDGYRIPARSGVYINYFTLHRHPEFWPDPERFDPERFTAAGKAARPRNAYQPFGSGPRICIGKHFALAELLVITAMILQTYRLRPAPGAPVRVKPMITLRPDRPIRLELEAR